jgi:peptide deformylase
MLYWKAIQVFFFMPFSRVSDQPTMQNRPSRVVKNPNPVLGQNGRRVVDPSSPEIQKLIDEMIEIMHEEVHPGTVNVGIAAHQVGVALKLCVVEVDEFREVFINPKITSFSRETETEDEGCMSVPGTYLPIKRHRSVQVRYEDRSGKKCKLRLTGFLARVIQHELDHLEGKLILDRAGKS